MINNELVFKSIAEALLSEYLCVYFVNAATNEYIFYTADSWFRSLHKGLDGKDFYADVIKVTEKVIYEDDKYIFLNENLRDLLLSQVENDAVHLTPYRLVIDGEPVYFRSKLIRGIDREDGCFIIGVKNVDKQVKERLRAEIYNQIAGSLAEHYDTVYYVDIETNNYFEYSSTDIYKSMQVPETGEDFFAETRKNMKKYIHPEDQARIMPKFEREAMLKNLSDAKICSEKYRLVVNGEIMHCRCSQMRANDKKHILVCIENINDEVKKEQEQIAALDRANELARCDGLTGAKNMTAYREFEDSMQKSMDSGKGRPCFAIVVCDINDLKRVNDLGGHKLGDEHIRSACRMISSVFAHSLVFRIGGDEFAVVLAGSDYEKRSQLVEILKKDREKTLKTVQAPQWQSALPYMMN